MINWLKNIPSTIPNSFLMSPPILHHYHQTPPSHTHTRRVLATDGICSSFVCTCYSHCLKYPELCLLPLYLKTQVKYHFLFEAILNLPPVVTPVPVLLKHIISSPLYGIYQSCFSNAWTTKHYNSENPQRVAAQGLTFLFIFPPLLLSLSTLLPPINSGVKEE